MTRLAGRLVIATHNPGKLTEMAVLLAPYGIDAVSAGALGLPEPEETGTTFAANAALKARAAADASGLPALSDDSGLCVDALDGAPGIYSARWGGVNKDFSAAMARVETELRTRGANRPSLRISPASSASPGRTDVTRLSRDRCSGRLSFRRRERSASATIRSFARWATPGHSAKCLWR